MLLYHRKYFLAEDKDWVVFVHGAGGSSSIWFRQIRTFKKHFNVLLIDLRGHGRSKHFFEEYMQNRYNFNDISRDVLDVLDHLKIQKAHFVGISLASIIIRSIAEQEPERITSMTLGGAVIRLNVRSKILMYLGNKVKSLVPYMWIYSFFAWVIMPRRRHRKSRSMFIEQAKKLYQKEFLRWYHLTSEVNPLLRYFREEEIPVPTLYIMGQEDYMFLPQVKQLVSKHKHALLQIFEDCGHVVNIDQADLFNETSMRFIKNPTKFEPKPV
ncbi:alpha/beta hydrolase [uncultured Microscilla sp.]|uniref:alpha/beta fold hydrolase n=1 Tax=uncultured Microscilla sp. TaxID=432653 RepID=UPI00263766B7|nr:alpha/beta hydrolase [uncultured Microscilla sp.]